MLSLDSPKLQSRTAFSKLPDAKQEVPPAKVEVLVKDFSEILHSHDLADVRLLCGPTKSPIIAHRAILAARCHYFLELFKNALKSTSKGIELQAPPSWGPAIDSSKQARLSHIGDTPFQTPPDSGLEVVSLEQGSPEESMFESSPEKSTSQGPKIPLFQASKTSSAMSATPSSTPTSKSTDSSSSSSRKDRKLKSGLQSLSKESIEPTGGETAKHTHVAYISSGILWIELPEYTYDHLAPVIEYLYSMAMPLSATTVVGIYSVAHELGLQSVGPEIIMALPSILSDETVFDIMLDAFQKPHCEPILKAVFSWLSDDSSRSNAMLRSPRFSEIPLELITQMMGYHISSDEYVLYERLLEVRADEIEPLLQQFNFQRMTAQQLMRVHSTGKVSDSVILEAFRRKIAEGLILDRVSGGSSVVLELLVFGESASTQRQSRHGPVRIAASISPRDPSPESKERVIPGAPTSGTRAGVSGISPATILRRKSVANITDAERVSALGSDTWSSDSFRVHGGDWTVHLKTRGGLLYKVGMTLNHTANDCDGIQLDMWSITVTNTTRNSPPYEFNFGTTTFSMGREVFHQVDVSTSGNLGFNTNPHPFKLPPRSLLQITVQFPTLSKISFILDG